MPTRKYVDLDLNFLNNPITGDISKVVGNQAIIRAIENLVLIHFYESHFNPSVGSNTYRLLFENITDLTALALQREIETVVNNYEPRAKISFLSVTASPDDNGYDVRMEFYVDNSIQPVAVAIFLERIG